MHTNINDTVEAIQDTSGTTLGTNLFMHMAAGNFPARVTGVAATGTFVQTLVGGTLSANIISNQQGTLGFLNKGTLGSVQSLGGTFNSFIMGSPNGTGGTLANMQLIGTPQITGGTWSSATVPNYVRGPNTGLIVQMGTTEVSGTISGGSSVTVNGTYATPFSSVPFVVGLVRGITSHGQLLVSNNTITGTVVTFNIYNEGASNPTAQVSYIAVGSI